MTRDAYSETRRLATVVAHTPKGLQVAVKRQAGCERCEQGAGCGAGLFAQRRQWLIEVSLPARYSALQEQAPFTSSKPQSLVDDCDTESGKHAYPIGSEVMVGLPAVSLSMLSLFVYTVPLFMALVLSGAVSLYGFPDLPAWSAPALFFAALIATLVALKYTLGNVMERFRPRLIC
ncbi:SoxR reducing system RseC family protein [Vreelandella aquamarina]